MFALKPHIIQKQYFEVHTSKQEDALFLQNSISEQFKQDILPKLDELLSRYVGPEEYLRIGRLVLQLSGIHSERLNEEFPQQFLQTIEKELQQLEKGEKSKTTDRKRQYSTDDIALEQFFFFLKTGRLPWWAPQENPSVLMLEEGIGKGLKNGANFFILQLVALLRQEPSLTWRLVNQFSDKLLDHIVEHMISALDGKVNVDFYQKSRSEKKVLSRNGYYHKAFEEIIQSNNQLKSFQITAKIRDGLKKDVVVKEEAIFIHHAGLPLLHPFLPPFFAACGLLDEAEQQFRDAASRERAIHLLYYAGAGRSEPPEFELPVHKLLCGVPLEAPVPRKLTLTRKEKAEAGRLLASVIEQWPALKNTDPPTFRDGFLQREGKLLRIDDGWKLIVETKAQDILLSRLPWGMGVIRLPWMREMVMVDWG